MTDRTKTQGLLALSPLIVFLGIYLISSIVAGDFYKIPIASAFLIASAYGLLISKKGPLEDKIAIFSQGAGQKNVLLMLWIFILAGAFAETAKRNRRNRGHCQCHTGDSATVNDIRGIVSGVLFHLNGDRNQCRHHSGPCPGSRGNSNGIRH